VIIYSQKTKTYWVGEYQYLKWTQNKDGWIKLFNPLKVWTH
jgi:hypothetical protein